MMVNNHLNPNNLFNSLNTQIATFAMQVQSLEGVNTMSSPQICCYWSGEWGSFDEPMSFNFVGSYNHNLNYSYTCNSNLGWIDHPSFE